MESCHRGSEKKREGFRLHKIRPLSVSMRNTASAWGSLDSYRPFLSFTSESFNPELRVQGLGGGGFRAIIYHNIP